MDLSSKFEPNTQWDKDTRDGTQLAQRVTEYLRKMIMEGELPPETQLPNEPDLSALSEHQPLHRSLSTGHPGARWIHPAPLGRGHLCHKEPTHLQ